MLNNKNNNNHRHQSSAYLVKAYGAVFQAVVLALVTPLSVLAYALPAFQSAQGAPPNGWTWIGLVSIAAGVAYYRWAVHRSEEEERQEMKEPTAAPPIWVAILLCCLLALSVALFVYMATAVS